MKTTIWGVDEICGRHDLKRVKWDLAHIDRPAISPNRLTSFLLTRPDRLKNAKRERLLRDDDARRSRP